MFASLDEPEQYLVHDMRFHQTIAAASRNRILTALMNMVATICSNTQQNRQTRQRFKGIGGTAPEYLPRDARPQSGIRPQRDARPPDRNAKSAASRKSREKIFRTATGARKIPKKLKPSKIHQNSDSVGFAAKVKNKIYSKTAKYKSFTVKYEAAP